MISAQVVTLDKERKLEGLFRLQLDGGEIIHLEEIIQSKTYAGLLEGLPTKKMNKRLISGAEDKTRKLWGHKPELIKPIETKIETERKYFLGTPAAIPKITCMARFKCFEPVKDKSKDYSEASIVWYQGNFALPIDSTICDKIKALSWRNVAFDFEY